MTDIITLKSGEKLKISITLDNATDGWAGEYKIDVWLVDTNASPKKSYYLRKNLAGDYYFETVESMGTMPTSTIAAGTSTALAYTAAVPDTNEGTIQGNVEIYDGDTFVVGSDNVDAYKYQKKKYSMTLSVTWEKG